MNSIMGWWKLAETICVVRVLLTFLQDSKIGMSCDVEVKLRETRGDNNSETYIVHAS
jgi:hypothetical protein